MLTTELLQLN